jgi:hypothetical protein
MSAKAGMEIMHHGACVSGQAISDPRTVEKSHYQNSVKMREFLWANRGSVHRSERENRTAGPAIRAELENIPNRLIN